MNQYPKFILAQALSDYEKGQAIGQVFGLIIGVAIGLIGVFWWMKRLSKQPPVTDGPSCPGCGEHEFKPVAYTWWGGALGPKMLNHVYCLHCKTQFNSKTGKLNTLGITIYVIVSGMIGIALAVGLIFLYLNGRL